MYRADVLDNLFRLNKINNSPQSFVKIINLHNLSNTN